MPFNGNQGAVAAADYNTTPGAVCDNTNMTGICIPSPTGPVPVSAAVPLPVAPSAAVPGVLTPFPATPFIVVAGVSVALFAVPVGTKYICISVHTTAPGVLYLAFVGPAVVGFGISVVAGTNYVFDASSGIPVAGTVISGVSSIVNHVVVEFFT